MHNRKCLNYEFKQYYIDELRYGEYIKYKSIDEILLHWCCKYGLINMFKFYVPCGSIQNDTEHQYITYNTATILEYTSLQRNNMNDYKLCKLIALYHQIGSLLYMMDKFNYSPKLIGIMHNIHTSASVNLLIKYGRSDIIKKIYQKYSPVSIK